MPLFVIIGHDVADSTEKRLAARPAHLERITALHGQNRLVAAGPTPIEFGQPAMSGSIIIAHFDDIEAAKLWASEDPYIKAGVYGHVDVKPFIQVLPKPDEHA